MTVTTPFIALSTSSSVSYTHLDVYKRQLVRNVKAILIGIIAGVLASVGSVFGLCLLFGLGHEYYVTLLPKSITTAIGMGAVSYTHLVVTS